jgi:hypothetical protein
LNPSLNPPLGIPTYIIYHKRYSIQQYYSLILTNNNVCIEISTASHVVNRHNIVVAVPHVRHLIILIAEHVIIRDEEIRRIRFDRFGIVVGWYAVAVVREAGFRTKATRKKK